MAKKEILLKFKGFSDIDEQLLSKCSVKGLLKGSGYSYTKKWTKNERRAFGKIESTLPSFKFYVSVVYNEDPNIESNVVVVDVPMSRHNDLGEDSSITIVFEEFLNETFEAIGRQSNRIIIGSDHPLTDMKIKKSKKK